MIASGADPSFQLQPGISPDGCTPDGTTTNRGWTEATLREFLSFLDEKGVRVVTIWTSDAFLMPRTTFTCPWFMPLLRDWVGAKSDDEASGSEAAQPRSQYPLLHIGSKINCSADAPCTKDDGDDGNGRTEARRGWRG